MLLKQISGGVCINAAQQKSNRYRPTQSPNPPLMCLGLSIERTCGLAYSYQEWTCTYFFGSVPQASGLVKYLMHLVIVGLAQHAVDGDILSHSLLSFSSSSRALLGPAVPGR